MLLHTLLCPDKRFAAKNLGENFPSTVENWTDAWFWKQTIVTSSVQLHMTKLTWQCMIKFSSTDRNCGWPVIKKISFSAWEKFPLTSIILCHWQKNMKYVYILQFSDCKYFHTAWLFLAVCRVLSCLRTYSSISSQSHQFIAEQFPKYQTYGLDSNEIELFKGLQA